MLDVYVLPVNITSGIETPEMPGLFISTSPRFANRHRSDEILILYLNINENAAISMIRIEDFFDSLSKTYFKTPGTVTMAVRGMIQQLNEFLVQSNREKVREGKQTIGILNLAVLHKEQLFIAHAGDTHTLLLSPEKSEDFYQEDLPTHGLGQKDTPDLSFYQAVIQPGNTLIFGNKIPLGLTQNIGSGGGRISLEQLRRRLTNLPAANVQNVILQFQTGKGQIHNLKPRASASPAGPEKSDPLSNSQSKPGETQPVFTNSLEHPAPPVNNSSASRPNLPLTHSAPVNINQPIGQDSEKQKEGILSSFMKPFHHPPASSKIEIHPPDLDLTQPLSTSTYHPTPRDNPPASSSSLPTVDSILTKINSGSIQPDDLIQNSESQSNRGQSPQPESPLDQIAPLDKVPWQKWLLSIFKGSQKKGEKIKQDGNTLLVHMLPGEQEQLPQLSPSIMLVIAIAIPIIIAAVAVTIYYQLGPQKQFQDNMNQAEKSAAQISTLNDPLAQIGAMQQTIQWLDKAEQHMVTDQSKLLRMQIQDGLDKVNNIKRVIYHPISDNLDPSVNITRILANTTDVYLLDSTHGRIIRLIQNGTQYRMDVTFECSPGQVGMANVGNLVDFVLLPPDTPNKASVMGIDKNGYLLYCIPGEKPLAKNLTPPDMGWGTLKSAFLDDNGLLYVMDTGNNSVFIYLQQDYTYPDPPRLYFNDQLPSDMTNMIDMAINRNEIFLLNSDGHMAHCIFRAQPDTQTRCTDINQYHDIRPGKLGDHLKMDGTNFTRMDIVGVPDPSIFFLDTVSSSVYQHSLRLTFYRQLQMQLYPDFAAPQKTASAFTISPSRAIWIAYGNEIFYGLLP